jgi:hypothetical protein
MTKYTPRFNKDKSGKTDLDSMEIIPLDYSICKCGKTVSDKLHACVYDADINNDSTPKCNCCPSCVSLCAEDI